MNRLFLAAIITVTACLVLPATAQTKQEIRNEVYEQVTFPCFMEWADGDRQEAMTGMTVIQDTVDAMTDQTANTFIATASRGDRMAAYPVWRNMCLRMLKLKPVVVSEEDINDEVAMYVALPCAVEGRFGGDKVKAAVFLREHKEMVDELADIYSTTVNATASADDRKAAYVVLKNLCLNR